MNAEQLDVTEYGRKDAVTGSITGPNGRLAEIVSVWTDAIEVEFVTATGHTQALVTLTTKLVRPVGPKDILAVRQLDAA